MEGSHFAGIMPATLDAATRYKLINKGITLRVAAEDFTACGKSLSQNRESEKAVSFVP
jgi:hypothetical protein